MVENPVLKISTALEGKVKVKIKGDGQECPPHKSSLSHTPAELRFDAAG